MTQPAANTPANRMSQAVLMTSTMICSWLGMQIVHEFGHVLGAWATGGAVERVVLHPLTISRTDVGENPSPLFVSWAGPVFGSLFPAIVWGASATKGRAWAFLPRFFAGFCLVANGVYLAAGSFHGIGDCGALRQHGTPMWQLWLFGAVTVPAGFFCWHNQGAKFGVGKSTCAVDTRHSTIMTVIMLLLITVELLLSGR